MLKLTNANELHKGNPLMIAARHVVSIRQMGDFTDILTSTGVVYSVTETVDEIGRQPAWAAV